MDNQAASSQTRALFLLCSIFLYLVVTILSPIKSAPGIEVLAVLPVLLAGWFYGIQGGIAGGVISVLALIARQGGVYPGFLDGLLQSGALAGSIALLFIGAATGWMRKMHLRSNRQTLEQRALEQTLVENEARLRMLFNTMGDAMMIAEVLVDSQGNAGGWKLLAANHAFEQFECLNSSHMGAAQRPYGCTFDLCGLVEPKLLGLIDQSLKSNSKAVGEIYLKSNQQYIELVVSPFASGQVSIVLRDVTASRRAEQVEREQRLLAEALRDTASLLNSSLDLDEVLDRILNKIGTIVPYDAVNIALIQDTRVYIAREHGYSNTRRPRPDDIVAELENAPIFRRMAESGQPFLSRDTQLDPEWHTLPGLEWVKSYIGIPILIDGKAEGFLNLDSETAGYYNQQHLDKLRLFADQAAIAIKNSRLFEATDTIAHRLELMYQFSAALNHSIELGEVFAAALDGLVRALGVDQAVIALYDESRAELRVVADHTSTGVPSAVGALVPLDGNTSMERLLQTRRMVYVADVSQDPRVESVRSLLLERRASSTMIVPLVQHEKVAGIITLGNIGASSGYSPEEINLIETVANLTAVRIEQSRLYHAERRRAAELARLHTTLLDISTPGTQDKLLDSVIGRAVWLVNAHAGRLYLCSQDTEEIRCVACKPEPVGMSLVMKYGEGAAGWVARTGKPLLVADSAAWGGKLSLLEAIPELASLLIIPIQWQGQVRGLIQLCRTAELPCFSEDDQDLLSLFASQAAIALENGDLYSELHHQAITDARTGLYNLRGLSMLGGREVERALRYGRPVAAIMIDIDHFKRVNDAYGHAIGDQVLVALAENVHKLLRHIDILARYGGEEFVAILPECDSQTAEKIANRMRQAVEWMVVHTRKVDLCITASFGVSQVTEHIRNLDELIISADAALYKAKQSGRNCVRLYRPGDTGPLTFSVRLEEPVRKD